MQWDIIECWGPETRQGQPCMSILGRDHTRQDRVNGQKRYRVVTGVGMGATCPVPTTAHLIRSNRSIKTLDQETTAKAGVQGYREASKSP